MERSAYTEMAEIEDRHWWFSARREFIASLIRRFLSEKDADILDAGSGTGGNIGMLSSYGKVRALEMDAEAAAYSASRFPDAEVAVGSLPLSPSVFPGLSFGLITMLDVLEHVQDDAGAVASAAARLKPGGILLATVPAFQWLYGPHDRELHHFRRYEAAGLRGLSEAAGLRTEKISYFCSLLFPAVVVSRAADLLLKRNKAYGMKVPPAPMNAFLRGIFRAETRLLGGFTLPFGSSLVLVARKQVPADQRGSNGG